VYDIERLRRELRRALGIADNVGPVDYYIGAHLSFDGDPAIEVPVDFDGSSAFLPLVEVPGEASTLELWFRGWARFSGTAEVFDSNDGNNYRFTVAE
jgi:hypothetical protein